MINYCPQTLVQKTKEFLNLKIEVMNKNTLGTHFVHEARNSKTYSPFCIFMIQQRSLYFSPMVIWSSHSLIDYYVFITSKVENMK